ncbi:hypothetical protein B0H10DRAFT_1956776 [Mycena sp. CBHHK59/15]|nr:hypothetical protein B0H10DRAFT_1956776 [Mycena sp. CBHHK59/15]
MSEAPNALGLPTETGMKAAAPARCTQQLPPASPYPPYPYYLPSHGPYGQPYYPLPTPVPAPAPALLPLQPQQSPQRAKKTGLHHGTSLDSWEDNSPMLYPTIDDWLLDLDTGDCGEDGHQFNCFRAALCANSFVCLEQLADEGEGGAFMLCEICEDMTIGVSKLLVKYVIKDCKKIWKDVQKQKAEWEAN